MLILLVILFAVASTCVGAVEPWVEPRLSLANDLALRINVARQSAARGGSLGLTPLQSWSDAPDLLLDGSGSRRNLHQPLLEARPRFRQEFNGAMLSFDGTSDFLSPPGDDWRTR